MKAWASATELQSFRDDPEMRASLAATAARLEGFESNLERLAVSNAYLGEAVTSLTARMDRLSRRLEVADGTLGRLGRDGELAAQIETTRSRLDSLLIDAKSRPLRYLRFRLF